MRPTDPSPHTGSPEAEITHHGAAVRLHSQAELEAAVAAAELKRDRRWYGVLRAELAPLPEDEVDIPAAMRERVLYLDMIEAEREHRRNPRSGRLKRAKRLWHKAIRRST
ncbi:hypothetical protein [Bradyrhizobium tunisiense]|uniref:hypothetical protein n=1 Tax=Bradyrhizobium tunisiense TaxID=3278709 RepID=UPI0035DD73FA